MRAALIDLSDPENVRVEIPPGAELKIGRHASNTLVVQDEHCSRHHAVIVDEGGRWVLRDRGSQNGSYVDDSRVKDRIVLHNGQELRFGGLRYRFEMMKAEGEASSNGHPDPEPPEPMPSTPRPDSAIALLDETTFQVNQLAALCRFMAEATNETDARKLIRRALETVRANTSAEVVGFISLDDEGRTAPRLVLPAGSEVDAQLSSHLTSEVQKRGQTMWLKAERQKPESPSLFSYDDAICVPMPERDRWLGALHAYRRQRQQFSALAPRFCEVVAWHLAERLKHLRRNRKLQAENSRLQVHDLLADHLVGRSESIKKLDATVKRAAPFHATVLIRGETGTGKELIARALHQGSSWKDGPFEVVNCATISAELFDSHLFGHKKGAFTSAVSNRDGAFLQADGGTLFLDEIGELPPASQAKLLRVLENGLVQAVGGDDWVPVNVRVLAASNRNLPEMVESKAFRSDLFFRLRVVEIEVSPLRDRLEDLPDLVDYYLERLEQKHGRKCRLTPQAMNRLRQHSWPGNVRELVNALQGAVISSASNLIDASDLCLWGQARIGGLPTLHLKDLERLAYEEALRRTGQNISQMKDLLGAGKTTIYAKLKEYGWVVDKETGVE